MSAPQGVVADQVRGVALLRRPLLIITVVLCAVFALLLLFVSALGDDPTLTGLVLGVLGLVATGIGGRLWQINQAAYAGHGGAASARSAGRALVGLAGVGAVILVVAVIVVATTDDDRVLIALPLGGFGLLAAGLAAWTRRDLVVLTRSADG